MTDDPSRSSEPEVASAPDPLTTGGRELFDAIVHSIPTQIALVDERMRIVAANDAWRQAMAEGRTGGGCAIGASLPSCMAALNSEPVGQEMLEAALTRLLAGRDPYAELRYTRDVAGETRHMVLRAARFNGRGAHAVLMQDDMTERLRTKRELQNSERRFRSIIENLGEGLVMIDRDGTVTYLNARAQEILGYDLSEIVGKPVRMIFPTERQFEVERSFGPLVSRSPEHYQMKVVRKTGETLWVEVHSSPIPGERGRVEGVVVAFFDVTEHRTAAEALERAEAHYRRLVTAAPQAIYALDLAGRFTELNAAGEQLLGRSAEELMGKPYQLVIAPDDLLEAIEVFSSIASGEAESTTTELRLRRPNGEVRWAHISVAAIVDEGRIVGLHGIAQDTTEERLTAAQYRQAQKMEAIGRLAGGVAHDFNNLLTAITGYSSLLSREVEPASDAADFLGEIQRAAARSSDLTRQLLAFSRQQVLSPRIFDLRDVMRSMEKMLRRMIGEDVELRLSLPEHEAPVNADPGQMEQVLMNLAVNARDAMPTGGELDLILEVGERCPRVFEGTATAADFLCIHVRDTGHGMDEPTRERIFEPFFTTRAEGTGLGLATVYGIVAQSGGTIELDTAPGAGTTFRIYLPIAEAGVGSEELGETGRPWMEGSGETILLVEDDPAVRNLVHRVLRDSRFRILTAQGGQEALAIADSHPGSIDVLLSDVVMPGLSGGALYRTLRQQRPDLRAIFMTGYAEASTLRAGGIGEGTPLIRKPFTPEELLGRIRQTLEHD